MDIRKRNWLSLNTKVSKILSLLIEVENDLMDLDDYQMGNHQCYPDFEELYNRVALIRKDFTNYIDQHQELLTMDKETDKHFEKNKQSN